MTKIKDDNPVVLLVIGALGAGAGGALTRSGHTPRGEFAAPLFGRLKYFAGYADGNVIERGRHLIASAASAQGHSGPPRRAARNRAYRAWTS